MHSDRGASPRLAVVDRSSPACCLDWRSCSPVCVCSRIWQQPKDGVSGGSLSRPSRALTTNWLFWSQRKLRHPSEMGARRSLPDRVDRGRDPYALSPAEYASQRANYAATAAEHDYYRGRGRGDTPERKYASPYSRDPAYAGRYSDPRMDDPRYSPRHAIPHRRHLLGLPTRSAPHDPSIPPYPRSSNRYSPGPSPRSPSYAHRSAAHPSSQAPPPPHDPTLEAHLTLLT